MRTEKVELVVSGFKIRGTLCLPVEEKRRAVFVILHGLPFSPEPVEQKGYLDFAYMIVKRGAAAALLNLRGTDSSEGYFGLSAWVEDAEAYLRYLGSRLKGYKQYLLGFSAGGVVAIYVGANNKEVAGVVSCSASYRPLSQSVAKPLLERALSASIIKGDRNPSFIERLLSEAERYSPSKYIISIAPRPILIVHGRLDDLVPVEDAYKLYEEAKEPKKLLILDAGHRLRANPTDAEKIVEEAFLFINP